MKSEIHSLLCAFSVSYDRHKLSLQHELLLRDLQSTFICSFHQMFKHHITHRKDAGRILLKFTVNNVHSLVERLLSAGKNTAVRVCNFHRKG